MADGTLKVGTITTSSGSGTITLGQSGETVDMSNGTMTLNSSMKMTPAFSAYMSADQSSIADNTSVKVNMNTEFFDSDGKYDTSNYRFTPTIAGEYVFGSSLHINSGNTMETVEIALYKNGSKLLYATTDSNDGRAQITGIINLDIYRSTSSSFVSGGKSRGLIGMEPANAMMSVPIIHLDSPSTTSAITYTIYFRNNGGSTSSFLRSDVLSSFTALEIGA